MRTNLARPVRNKATLSPVPPSAEELSWTDIAVVRRFYDQLCAHQREYGYFAPCMTRFAGGVESHDLGLRLSCQFARDDGAMAVRLCTYSHRRPTNTLVYASYEDNVRVADTHVLPVPGTNGAAWVVMYDGRILYTFAVNPAAAPVSLFARYFSAVAHGARSEGASRQSSSRRVVSVSARSSPYCKSQLPFGRS